LAPAVPGIISQKKKRVKGNPYFHEVKSSAVRLLPRLEAMRLWTGLRRDGESGLTDDEAFVIRHLLEGLDSDVDCVTDFPTEKAVPIRVGRIQYYRARLPAQEFASSLATVSRKGQRGAYLPRDAVLRLDQEIPKANLKIPWRALGEWCYLAF
jgi:hypothetical protein